MTRHTTVLLAAWLAVGCASGTATHAAGTQGAAPSAAASSGQLDEASDAPAPIVFSGTTDDVIAELTDDSMTCQPGVPSKGFEVTNCETDINGNHFSVATYARANGDVAGSDMTIILTDPTDEDTLLSFVAFGLAGAMGPDAYNAVSDAISTRLDGSSPQPVWLSPDLRLTVRSSGTSLFVTVLAADLAAVWGP